MTNLVLDFPGFRHGNSWNTISSPFFLGNVFSLHQTAGSVLNYFEPFLGRIEIMGSSKRIERVYFEIKEENIDQWEKPQIKESKRGFFYAIVTEGDKEKLEAFVNFCEDAIFEMQHAAALMEEEDDALAKKSSADGLKYLSEEEEEK